VIYRALLRTLLSRIDAERAHHAGMGALHGLLRVPGLGALLRRLLAPRDPRLAVDALGLRFASPLGVAAGFDKEGAWSGALGTLGFAFAEVGTATAQPQTGASRPRIFRLIADRALINRMGFPNPGAAVIAARIAGERRRIPVGANIGRTRAVADEQTAADYAASARELAPVADFLVINVSSPNTPGLRDLQTTARLRELIAAVRTEIAATAATGRGVPLLVKISPDLADDDIDAIADLALETGLDGIVAVNTTTTRDGLLTPATDVEAIGAGGLSGAPLAGRSSAVLRRLRDRLGDRVVLISVGGIDGPEEAWARIAAGATLVQAYTGFVYGGPLWPARVNRGLARLVSAAGHATIADAIGTAAGSGEARDAPRPGAR